MKMFIYLRVFLLSISLVLSGCLESSFQLSPESRLPRWFHIPEGLERDNLSVQMELHSTFTGGKVVFKLYKKGNIIDVKRYTVTSDEQPGIRSVQLDASEIGYPRYKIVTINNVTDIVELQKMEPVFYMTDDPVVWKKLGVKY